MTVFIICKAFWQWDKGKHGAKCCFF